MKQWQPVAGIRCVLGEGLIWDWKARRLLMTDIANNKLLEIDIDSATHQGWDLPEPVGWVFPTKQPGVYAVGLKSGIALFDTGKPDELRWLTREFPGNPQCRLNDACTDSTGRIWCGSMNREHEQALDGKLASFSPAEGLRIHDAGFAVTNGPLVAPNGQVLYFNDTLNGVVYRYELSLNSGKIANREAFIRFSEGQGYPDGMCFDVEGNIWVAMWEAAKVIRVDPEGQLIATIDIPAINVTNVCFAGENMDRMYVSTASLGMDAIVSREFPEAGQLFEIMNHGTKGLPSHPFEENTL